MAEGQSITHLVRNYVPSIIAREQRFYDDIDNTIFRI